MQVVVINVVKLDDFEIWIVFGDYFVDFGQEFGYFGYYNGDVVFVGCLWCDGFGDLFFQLLQVLGLGFILVDYVVQNLVLFYVLFEQIYGIFYDLVRYCFKFQ